MRASGRITAHGGGETAPSAAVRLAWVDETRGIGIVLVVFGHVWRGLEPAGLIADGALFRIVDGFVYAFHMPLFFFLSGLFFHDALMRRPLGEMLRSNAARLLWPLVLWTYIFFMFKGLAGDAANRPAAWSEFPLMPLPPREQFWFLWALFVVQTAFALLRPLLVRLEGGDRAVWLAVLGATLAPYFLRPGGDAAAWFGQAAAFAPYFALGVLAGQSPPASVPAGRLAFLAFLAFLAAAGAAAILRPALAGALTLGVAAVLCLVLAVRAASPRMPPALRVALGHLGAASMAIYLAHVIFGAGFRIALLGLGVRDLAIHLALGCAAGLAGPLALRFAARRAGLARFAGF